MGSTKSIDVRRNRVAAAMYRCSAGPTFDQGCVQLPREHASLCVGVERGLCCLTLVRVLCKDERFCGIMGMI